MKTKILGLLAMALLAGPMAANAAPITVYFQTTITSITRDPSAILATNGISAGAVINGTYVYDDAATNTDSNCINCDNWNLLSMSANLPWALTPFGISASDFGPTFDRYTVGAMFDVSSNNSGFFVINLDGNFGYGSELGGGLGHLIKAPPVLDTSFAGTVLAISGMTAGATETLAVGSTILSLSPFTSVPEPGTLALLGLGLAGLGLSRRRTAN